MRFPCVHIAKPRPRRPRPWPGGQLPTSRADESRASPAARVFLAGFAAALLQAAPQPAAGGAAALPDTPLGIAGSTARAARPPTFTRIADSATVQDGGLSRGVAWGDYDGDGDPDLIVANTIAYPEFLYRNEGRGRFVQVLEVPPTLAGGYTEGVSWIDHDNDGDLDLFLTNTDGPNALFRNEGRGDLARVDAGSLTNDIAASSMACWADVDGDSWLDVFVVNRRGERDALYRNVAGQFERMREGVHVDNAGDGRACAWGDGDGDGDMDLYVGNFLDQTLAQPAAAANYYYRNEGNGSFAQITAGHFVEARALTYGISWVDVDDDEDLDLFVSNIGRNDDNWLYLNDGRGSFDLSTAAVVTDSTAPSKGHTWGDFDLDGDQDLYVANGTEGTDAIRNFLYSNAGGGRFLRQTRGAPVEDAHVSAGVAWADIDRDGDLDLYVANWGSNDEDNDIYRNDTPGQHWIALSLVGRESNHMALGAKIVAVARLHGTSRRQVRWLLPQTGYASQNEPVAHFGLADASTVDELRITWPSGRHDLHRQVSAGRFYVVEEGGSIRYTRALQQP